MKLAVSCIAWDPTEDEEMAKFLNRCGVTSVEVVPPRIDLSGPEKIETSCTSYRELWESQGVAISSMQALLFGHPEFSLFGDREAQEKLLSFLKSVFYAGKKLGVTRYVFGSPKNRIRGSLSRKEAFTKAAEFFLKAGIEAEKHGGILCMEANPPAYGCDFVTTTEEAAELVHAVNHPGFGLHLDTGGILLLQEDIISVAKKYAALITHLHISAQNLDPIYERRLDLRIPDLINTLRHGGYTGLASIEMRKSANLSAFEHAKRAIEVVTKFFNP